MTLFNNPIDLVEVAMAGAENPDGHPEVIVCAGPPQCRLKGDAAFESAQAGCPICKHIVCHPDGSETEYRKKAH
jgi:hypothetical protein